MADRIPLVLQQTQGVAQELPATDLLALAVMPTVLQQLAGAVLTTISGTPITTTSGDFITVRT